jgi:hypothetical protein
VKALHFLVTYRCTRNCPHCFVWGSPDARGRMTTMQVKQYLNACVALGIGEVQFEGGEPFLHYEELVHWVRLATAMGLTAGAVTNGFWASDAGRARQLLEPLADAGLTGLMVSTDDYHGGEEDRRCALLAAETAGTLNIPVTTAVTNQEQVMFRGRASRCLAGEAAQREPSSFTACPHEQLDRPGRVHIDAFGYVHLCQGLAMGQAAGGEELYELIQGYNPEDHPVVGPLLSGGPLALASTYGLPLADGYADACHLCYMSRLALRTRFPQFLAPGHLYGDEDL